MSITKKENCIVCGSNTDRLIMQIKDHLVSNEIFDLVECTYCSFRYISNPPAENNAARYYETSEYIEHSDTSKGVVNTVYHYARKWMLAFKYRLIERTTQEKSIIDFGTGTGYFLNYMKSKGYRTKGIEISDRAREFGKSSFGLDIVSPDEFYQSSIAEKYDAVTFWHVLEHIYDPAAALQRVKDTLTPNGTIIVALPNYHCLEAKAYKDYWNGYDVPRHLWHFDVDTFTTFAENNGLKVAKMGRLPLDPFYNCLISESYRKSLLGYLTLPFVSMFSFIQGYLSLSKSSSIIFHLKLK